jgi:hypothetical protein
MHSQLAHTAAKLEIADRQRLAERARFTKALPVPSRSKLGSRSRAMLALLRRAPTADSMLVARSSADALR